jgi:hypothetical protein
MAGARGNVRETWGNVTLRRVLTSPDLALSTLTLP